MRRVQSEAGSVATEYILILLSIALSLLFIDWATATQECQSASGNGCESSFYALSHALSKQLGIFVDILKLPL